MNTKHFSIRRRRGGWIQIRTRYCAFYIRCSRGPVYGDYEMVPQSELVEELTSRLNDLRIDAQGLPPQLSPAAGKKGFDLWKQLSDFRRLLHSQRDHIPAHAFITLETELRGVQTAVLRTVFGVDHLLEIERE